MPVPSALVSRYFQLLVTRQFTEAQRELERIKQKIHKTEWNRGYYRALCGMLLARRSNNNDSYAFFSHLDLTDKAALHSYRREFLEHVKNRLHGDFDRGFFSAWTDCMRVLSRIEVANIPNINNSANAQAPKKEIQTLPDDKSQATMESFIEEQD